MNEAGFITNTDYRDAFGVDRNTAKAALAKWMVDGNGRSRASGIRNS